MHHLTLYVQDVHIILIYPSTPPNHHANYM